MVHMQVPKSLMRSPSTCSHHAHLPSWGPCRSGPLLSPKPQMLKELAEQAPGQEQTPAQSRRTGCPGFQDREQAGLVVGSTEGLQPQRGTTGLQLGEQPSQAQLCPGSATLSSRHPEPMGTPNNRLGVDRGQNEGSSPCSLPPRKRLGEAGSQHSDSKVRTRRASVRASCAPPQGLPLAQCSHNRAASTSLPEDPGEQAWRSLARGLFPEGLGMEPGSYTRQHDPTQPLCRDPPKSPAQWRKQGGGARAGRRGQARPPLPTTQNQDSPSRSSGRAFWVTAALRPEGQPGPALWKGLPP